MNLLALVPLLVLLALSGAAARQEGPQRDVEKVPCKKCKSQGIVACSRHKRAECALEHNVLFCTEIADCETCGGAGWLDCASCENGPAQEKLEAKLKARKKAEKRRAKYEQAMERPLRMAVSEHFAIVCEIDSMRVGRAKMGGHELLHTYVDRLERLFADYGELFDVRPGEFGAKSEVMLWSNLEDHEKAGEAFCNYAWEYGATYRRGAVAVVSTYSSGRFNPDDATLHRSIVHHAIHGIMNLQEPPAWTGHLHGGWADAGLSHWFEDRYFGQCDSFCHIQIQGRAFKPKKWRTGVRKLVESGEASKLEQLVGLETERLTFEQHAMGFALVDYLVDLDPAKLNYLLKRLRSRTPTRDAVKEVYGWKIEELEAAWRAWVLENYK